MKSNRILILFLLLAALSASGCLQSSGQVKGAVRGKVFDVNGHVLPGAKVELYGGDHIVITDELGRFYIDNVDPGQRKLVATFQEKSVVKIVDIPRGEVLENADLVFDAIDSLPPVITDVKVADIGENQATVLWKTSEPADSNVDYATGPTGLGSYTFMATDSAMLTDHSITLGSLKPNTTYHFRVRSRDFVANEGISSDYQFSTSAGSAPATPFNFTMSPPTEMERITFTWGNASDPDLIGYNLYRAASKTGAFARVNANPIAQSASGTTTSYTDEGLMIAWKYYYMIKAVDSAGNESEPSATLSVVTPGSLAENRVWKASENPFIISGDIRIRGGSVLTIEPGVEVKFSQTDYLPDSNGATMTDLIVQGALQAEGTPDKPILFTSAETFPKKGNWGGIQFLSTTEPENRLKYATVLFADTGVKSDGSTPTLENVDIGLCPVGMDLGLSIALNVRFCCFRDCDIGLISASSNIRNNIFAGNQVGAAVLGGDIFEQNTVDSLIGLQIPFGTPTIRNNIFSYTGNGAAIYGIDQTQTTATATISYNDIFNFQFPTHNLTVATGPGNIASNPLFIGGSPYDYHLQTTAGGYASDSPCLTTGESGVQMGRYGP